MKYTEEQIKEKLPRYYWKLFKVNIKDINKPVPWPLYRVRELINKEAINNNEITLDLIKSMSRKLYSYHKIWIVQFKYFKKDK